MKLFKHLALVCAVLIGASILTTDTAAQGAGTISGRVIDANSGDGIIGVNVIINEIKKVTGTDINGRYALTGVPAGIHTVVFQMMGYNRTAAQVTVDPGAVRALNVSLSYLSTDEVVVTAKRLTNTEASLLSARKKAAVAQDAISSEQIAKSPDSNASDAAKRVVGITMDKDDRVIIRGLGERYSSVMLGDSPIPSPDPDRRIVPMDIFPVGLLDNLTVIKAYTPDLPGEFCGGVVQINPRDYPENLEGNVSIGTGMNFNTIGKDFWTYRGGKSDWFGVDDGTRAMPEELNKYGIGSMGLNSPAVPNILRRKIGISMKNIYSPETIKGMPDGKLSFSVGDSFRIKEKYTIGFIISGLFNSGFKNKEYESKELLKSFEPYRFYDGKESTYSVTKGGLLSLGFTSKYNKIRSTTFYTQKTDKKTKVVAGYNEDRQLAGGDIVWVKNNELLYHVDGLLFTQAAGEHVIAPADLTIEWNGSFALANRDEPDSRHIQLINPLTTTNPIAYKLYRPQDIHRYWLDHEDRVGTFNASLAYKFKQWSGIYAKIKAGGGIFDQRRKSNKRTFQWQGSGVSGTDGAHEPLEWYFGWPFIVGGAGEVTDNNHYYLRETTSDSDKYTGKQRVYNGYGMMDFPIIRQLRMVGGFRYENSTMGLTTWNQTYSMYTDLKSNPLQLHNYLGGVSLTATPIDDLNIRLAFSKTLARPDFREVSEFRYQLYTENTTMLGNRYLKQSDIQNYDARVEWFPSASEIIAASFFYKYLTKPIELVELQATTGAELYSYRNAKSARNIGCELEIRKNLGFGSGKAKNIMDNFIVSLNAAYIFSRIKTTMKKYITSEDISIPFNQDDYFDFIIYTNKKRPMQGQSPWIVNAGFEYANDKIGHSTSLLFNMFGRRIIRVGVLADGIPHGDVYEESYPRLDLVVKQKILEYGQVKLTLGNLIDPYITETQEQTHESYLIKYNLTRKKYRMGRSLGFGYTYSF